MTSAIRAKASWGSNETALYSQSELDALIEAVRQTGLPTMVFLEAENRNVLIFGLGHRESVLTFVEADGTSFHSLGDPDREGHLHFLCRDQVDEFLMEMAIPEHAAVKAAEQFLETNERPSAVEWEPDW